MAHDPDALESTSAEQGATTTAAPAGTEFATGPMRAEHSMARTRRSLPLWPWLVLAAVAIVVIIVFSHTG